LLVGSYVFYAWADWRFLAFLVGVSALNYILGLKIEKQEKISTKKILLYIGVLQGIGGLAFFKYFNFFVASFNDVSQKLGLSLNFHTLNLIIPLGISFFTFRTVSYLLDVDKGKIEATKNWVVFFNYVSFFPSILSGPIDKARDLVPQLEINRKFEYDQATDGMRQILWGLFKKIVIADSCAVYANIIFDNSAVCSGSTLVVGAFFFTIQAYADFSGYSDMAIGIARLLGINISKNFDFPFFSQNIAEFWRKWHISFTSWLTEYVFTPLCITFRDYGKFGIIISIIINFTICGIWHGPNWTYILFGFLHGCFFIPLIIKGTLNKRRKIARGSTLPSIKEFINVLMTFTLIMFSFVLFRANNVEQALNYYSEILSNSLFQIPVYPSRFDSIIVLFITALFFLVEWIGRENHYAIATIFKNNSIARWMFYYILVISILVKFGKVQDFIYAQF
jgi:D-alanyl-lipoteichoic acid acyltransferase DltB (MBOAT superfamily)